MSDTPQTQPPGWYYAQGDPPGTQRFWDGTKWEGGPQPVPGSPQGAAAAGAPGQLAEPINRIAARIIDSLLLFVISIPINIILIGGSAFGFSGAPAGTSYVAGFLASILITALYSAYEIYMIGSRGQTLGKMALNVKVVQQNGAPADYQVAAMRISWYLVLGVIGAIIPFIGILTGLISFVIWVASLVFLFTDSMRQTVWDKIAKTIVIPA